MNHFFDNSIIRAYDIRGIFNETLHPKDAYMVGLCFGSHLKNTLGGNKISIGYDGRLSSPALKNELIKGVLDSGVDVVEIGLVPTPQLYYSVFELHCDAGIMVTGSHNPPTHNGFKIMLKGGVSFFGDDLIALAKNAASGVEVSGQIGAHTHVDVEQEYLNKLKTSAIGKLNKKLKIAWDSGNGATAEVVNALVKTIDAQHFVINDFIDGTFPAHHPDPTVEKNMVQLREIVLKNSCDFGIAFDGDGDRIGVIDNKGNMLVGEQLLLIYAYDLVKRHGNPKIIADVKTSDSIFARIASLGATPIMWKTGHSHIKAKMKSDGAILAGEMSGHIFFGEDYYYFDDALFGACKLINIFANQHKTINEVVESFPHNFSTPEIKIEVPEEIKFAIIEELIALAKDSEFTLNLLDGLRASNELGWWLIRASNTQNCLGVRIESTSLENLEKLKGQFISLMQRSKYAKYLPEGLSSLNAS